MIEILAELTRTPWVAVDEVEGGGDVRRKLVVPDLIALPTTEVRKLAAKMTQFDWGDFFFILNEEELESLKLAGSLARRIVVSQLTLRCVDNGYFYIYGRDPDLLKAICGRFPQGHARKAPGTELDFPR